MALIRWRPRDFLSPFSDLQEEMNRLFDITAGRLRGGDIIPWSPSLDIYEEKDSLIVKADLPGLSEKDIDISIQGDTLTIRGERKQETETKEKDFYRCERIYGAFQRSVTLPYPVDQSKVKATYKHGVLEVRLPKAEEAKQKKIHVEVKE